MATFLISTLIFLVMILKKIFFFNLETLYAASFWGIIDIVGLSLLFMLGFMTFAREFLAGWKKETKRTKQLFDIPIVVLLIAVGILVGMSFYLNSQKISLHWDAIALYDARARFLAEGMKFSEMPLLSKYDNLNKYYYLLYPPYTSIGHFFWNSIGTVSKLPVGVYYSIALALLVFGVFFVTKTTLGKRASALLALLVASNSNIFNTSVKEYTNLPYTLHMVLGIFLLFAYTKTKKIWQLLYGIFFISASTWIRFLEPMWLVVILAFGIATLSRNDLTRKLLPVVGLILFSLIQYFSWAYFTKVIGGNPGVLTISLVTIVEPLLGILTGSWMPVLVAFLRSWSIPLFIHLITLVALGLRWRYTRENREILFLGLIILFSISFYFFQLYFVSFQADWWEAAARSLDRSSTFLIPVSGYVLIRLISTSRVLVKRD